MSDTIPAPPPTRDDLLKYLEPYVCGCGQGLIVRTEDGIPSTAWCVGGHYIGEHWPACSLTTLVGP